MTVITRHAIDRYKERFLDAPMDNADVDLHLRYLLKEAIPWGGQRVGTSSMLMATYDGHEIYFVIDNIESVDWLITCLNRTQAYANAQKLMSKKSPRHKKKGASEDHETSNEAERKMRKQDRKKQRRKQRRELDDY